MDHHPSAITAILEASAQPMTNRMTVRVCGGVIIMNDNINDPSNNNDPSNISDPSTLNNNINKHKDVLQWAVEMTGKIEDHQVDITIVTVMATEMAAITVTVLHSGATVVAK